MKKSKEIKELNWSDFIGSQEVQVDQSPNNYDRDSLFYNDGKIQVSVDIDPDLNHDEMTLWEDQNLAKELQALAVEELEKEEEWED